MKTRQQTRSIAAQRSRQQMNTAAQSSVPSTAPLIPKINFRIERLTLEGYTRSDQARFTRTFESKLRDLVAAAPGLNWKAAKGPDRIDAGTLPPGATPEQAARHIARQIFLGLHQKRRNTEEIAHA
jgi:hypothetical protein